MAGKDKVAKSVRFVIHGEIVLIDGVDLNAALAHVRDILAKARELGMATAQTAVPRLTELDKRAD